MATLLHIDSRPMGDTSISRRLTQAFAREWQQAHAHGEVLYRDLASAAMASLNFIEPWLRTLFGYLGVGDMRFVLADGAVNVLNGTLEREAFLAPHVAQVRREAVSPGRHD